MNETVASLTNSRILTSPLYTFMTPRRACIVPSTRAASFGDPLRRLPLMPRAWTGKASTRRLTVLLVVILVSLLAAAPAAFSQENDEAPLEEETSPRGALWRAAALPGWGQFYNGQYLKIPIVWAGLGGIAATAFIVNREYLLYRHSYHFLSRRENGEPVFPEYEEDFLRLINKLGISRDRAEASVDEFRQSRDKLRRNRDLLYIGIGLFYGLTILDAYVNAHLLQFDVGEDLTLTVQPTPAGVSATVRLRR